jgi:hypothetical protein
MTSDANSQPVFLYLHIPKTAGTTLTSCIYEACSSAKYYRAAEGRLHSGIYYYPGNFHKEADPVVPHDVGLTLKQEDISAVVGHFRFGIHEFLTRPSTYVTVLRNPLTRVLSLFHHICTYKSHGWRNDVLSKHMSIETFIETYRCREADNDQTRRLSGIEPPFGECTRDMLDLAKMNIDQQFAVVGITERFDETLVLIRRTFGWSQEGAYWPKLVNKNRPSPETLPQASVDAVLRRNELDMELYRYASAKLASCISRQKTGFQDEVAALVAQKHSVTERIAPREISQTGQSGCTA